MNRYWWTYQDNGYNIHANIIQSTMKAILHINEKIISFIGIGSAKCDDDNIFDEDFGKKLADVRAYQNVDKQIEKFLIDETKKPKDNTKISIQKDSNQWCVLWGENLQEGISGFGVTIEKAMNDFIYNANKVRMKKHILESLEPFRAKSLGSNPYCKNFYDFIDYVFESKNDMIYNVPEHCKKRMKDQLIAYAFKHGWLNDVRNATKG